MISILIPIYNFEVTVLVRDLHSQSMEANIPFEILCFDDGSQKNYKTINQTISSLANVNYQELPENLGRAKIRNYLAKNTQFPYLLFLDCDSKTTDNQYIKNYIKNLNPTTLLYGGRVYAKSPPTDLNKRLHYYYGKNREEILTEERKLSPYHSFMTNNFLIPASIFQQIQFNETITQYGHEDTLFGLELKKLGVKILHLNNPLEHLGLEDTDVFLEKQNRAIQNLYQLHQKGLPIETKLLNTFQQLDKWGLINITFKFQQFFFSTILSHLKKETPKLFYLDLYKLYQLLRITKFGRNQKEEKKY